MPLRGTVNKYAISYCSIIVQVNDDDNDDEDEPMAAEEVCIVIDIFHFPLRNSC
jgi:hypothetical protein